MDVSAGITSLLGLPSRGPVTDDPPFNLAGLLRQDRQSPGETGVEPTSLVAQAAIPGVEPNRSFATLEEAENYLRSKLFQRLDAPDSDGDVAFIFKSGDRFHVYGPDNLERFGDSQSPLGLNRLGPAYANRLSAAQAALGQDASFVSGGIIIHGFFHKLSSDADGYLMLGQPTRTF